MDSHMHMDGMSMGGAGIDSDMNHAFARGYWYLAAGVIGLFAAVRAVNDCGAVQRLRASADASVSQPTRPRGRLGQAWATATAVVREACHPQLYVGVAGLAWATPPPLGRVLLLLCYWAAVAYLMARDAVRGDALFWERIGFRNAWVTAAQLPMVYLLAMKINPVGWLVGVGHERLNWLHRWVARTMLVTATVHGFHFWTEWALADFVSLELAAMPVVKYGLGAWAVLLWTVVVGLVPVRRLAYEVWLAQHVVSAVVLLWLLYRHMPANALYLLWMAVAMLAADRAARWALLLWRNTRWTTPLTSPACCHPHQLRQPPRPRRFGHDVSLRAVGDAITLVTISAVDFAWSPGQHVYLWLPRLGPLEAHPYTVASAHRDGHRRCCCNAVQLVVRAHAGFSRRLHAYAARHPDRTLAGFVSGPFGAVPRWHAFETLVLIGTSTGASFTVPILEAVAVARPTCVRRIDFALVARTADDMDYYELRAREAARRARDGGIDVRLHVAITGGAGIDSMGESGEPLVRQRSGAGGAKKASLEKPAAADDDSDETPAVGRGYHRSSLSGSSGSSGSDSNGGSSDLQLVRQYAGRPDIEALIREPVEQAWGETAVVVCGGPAVVACTRNCVSRLSDERAVHKGTGAQGIYLHVEEYAF